mgnify:CR=1 FL=1
MTIFDSIILGIIEGVTEFLPISSTGHLILADKILGLPQTEFLKSFEIVIQLGAIAAVFVIFYKLFFNLKDLKKIVIGTIPTAVIGLGAYSIIKNNLLGSENVVVWAMLIGGVLLVLFEILYKGPDVPREEVYDITYPQAFYIGLFQVLAIIPGVSRSASTIIGGLLLGIPRTTVVQFSFLLAVPAILGASAVDIYHNPSVFSGANAILLLVGFLTSFVVAIISIKFLLRYIRNHNFIPFGVHRIVLALVFFFVIL